MGKRQGDTLHQDMDFDSNKPKGSPAGVGSHPKASAEVLAKRKKLKARRRNPGLRPKKPKTAPSIDLGFNKPGKSSTSVDNDAFAAFNAVPETSKSDDTTGNGSSSKRSKSGADEGSSFQSSTPLFATDDGDGGASIFGAPSGDDTTDKSSGGFNIFGDSNDQNNDAGASVFGSDTGSSTAAEQQAPTAADANGNLTKFQQQNLRRLNKIFKNQIAQNWKQYADGDWTIQMMEYIQFAKQVKQMKSGGKGGAGDGNRQKPRGGVARPRIVRNVTPHPSKGKKSQNADSSSTGGSGGIGGDDSSSATTSSVFGDAVSGDIFGTGGGFNFDIPAPAPEPAPAPAQETSTKAEKTGVDDPDVKHKLRSAMHKFKEERDEKGKPTGTKAWTKYGVGDVVIKQGDDGKAQLLMYNDTTGKLFINTYLTSKTATSLNGKALIMQIYYPEENENKGAWLNTMLKCKTPAIAKAFKEAIDKYKV